MEITQDLLLGLGFVKTHGKGDRYSYKGVVGYLRVEAGLFFFQGFTPSIGTIPDLKYMLMLIDYQVESSFSGYPGSMN